MEEQTNKVHKVKTVGNKAAKKDEVRKRRAGIDLEPNRGSNVKAFQGPSSGSHKAQKFFRSVEKRETALHVPTADKTLSHIVSEPPLLVAVVGPPGVGKTTLVRSMVKFYSSRHLQSIRGPITVVAGRSRRVTFVECPNTLSAMCDVAKVADLVLLMVDGSFGFEMDTFEFLNIAQVHGFPKIFGIVSHLDTLKTGKALKKRKKFLRHRFWHEVAAGAKLLCLSPMVRGMYRPTDVLNLHRLLICVEPKIQAWRNTHCCTLIDRHEDITNPEVVAQDPNAHRVIAFYGYTRGKPMKPGQLVHIPGLGDLPLQHLSRQDDPCHVEGNDSKSQGHRMRHLSMKQAKLYAPYCDVGGIIYDDDAIYVQEDAEKGMIERSGEGLQLLRELQRVEPIDAGRTKLDVVRRPIVFRNEETMELDMKEVRMPVDSSEDDDDSGEDDAADDLLLVEEADPTMPKLSEFGMPQEGTEGDAEEGAANSSLAPRLRNDVDAIRVNAVQHDWSDESMLRALRDLCVTGNWSAGEGSSVAKDDDKDADIDSKGYESDDEDFKAEARGDKPVRRPAPATSSENEDEGDDSDGGTSHPMGLSTSTLRVSNALASVGYGKVGMKGNSRGGEKTWEAWETDTLPVDDDGYNMLAEGDEASGAGTNDQEDAALDGLVASFLSNEALSRPLGRRATAGDGVVAQPGDTGIEFYDPKAHLEKRRGTGLEDAEEEARESRAVVSGANLTEEQERLLKKKMDKKKAFDEDYDAGGVNSKNMTNSYYHQLNRKVEEKKEQLDAALHEVGEDIDKKVQLVGYFSGLYVRFVIENIPVEFVKLFDPTVPLIAGGVNAGEDEYRIVQARVKRHRWYPKILKAQDPVLISMGWRRFQTQPLFASEDPNGRHRYLKYTPLHMHCLCAFYAPVAPPNTGFLVIPVRDQRVTNFRIPCTGYTIGNDVSSSIVKKLKLTGTPAKIEKTTVFVKGMFTSDIEAAKFVGAKLKSVSGIRGIIKSVLKGKNGLVRATFEDKLFPSDIVFIRAWKPVDPPRYCSIQRNLVDKNWVGMRTMRELRWAHNLPLPENKDSEYQEIKRRHRVDEDEEGWRSQKVLLSRNTKMQLPYDMKEEFIPISRTNELRERLQGATTVAPEARDQRRQALLDTFEDRADVMTKKREEAKKRARERAAKEAAKENEQYVQGLKRAKKETARRSEFRSQHKSRH